MFLVLFIYSFEIIGDYIKQKNYILTSRSSSTGWEQTNISGFLRGQGNIREFWISFIKNVSENVIKCHQIRGKDFLVRPTLQEV